LSARLILPEPIPLGVSDQHGRIGAVGFAEGGIDLIDLLAGEQLRRLPKIGHPLMIDGPHLLGWSREREPARRWRLFRAALPPADMPVEWSPGFDLPDWAHPQLGMELDFEISLARKGDRYLVHWKARAAYRGGPPPPPDIAHQEAAAGLAVDSGTLRPVAPHDGGIFADETALEKQGEHLARQARGFIYGQEGRLRNAPWSTPAGERFLRTLGTPGETRQQLSIARADDPAAPDLAEFVADDLDRTAPELSLDGRHLAVVHRASKGRVFWQVYSTETGEPAARVPYRAGFASFRIFDRRLICLEEVKTPKKADLTIRIERQLHALGTNDGRVLWSYTLPPKIIKDRSFLPPPPF
jgi:hypothetical protein